MEAQYTVYKFQVLNGITETIQRLDDIPIYWPAPVYRGWDEMVQLVPGIIVRPE